jgi:TetR/AcrR family transcriptional repressor of lmrAB and yxaGH operons
MAGESKQKIEAVATEMLARGGYTGMGLKAISEAAELPYGSIYHHFPGGKEQIAVTAISSVGTALGELMTGLFADGVTPRSIRRLFSFMADRLESSDWLDGCPIGAPTLDGSSASDPVRASCDEAFEQMIEPVAAALARTRSMTRRTARDLATVIIASYEGATILARAQRSKAPLKASAEAMVRLLSFVP